MSGSSTSLASVAALGLGLLLVAGPLAAQGRVLPGLDVELEAETLTGYAVSARAEMPLVLGGEAFDFLTARWGGSLAFTAFFLERYAARVRIGRTALDERGLQRGATMTELLGELLWRRELAGVDVEAGPAIGYSRLYRPGYGSTQGGFVAAGSVGGGFALTSRWRLVADGVLIFSSFTAPEWAIPPPAGFPDEGALGRRLAVGLGVEYRWGGSAR